MTCTQSIICVALNCHPSLNIFLSFVIFPLNSTFIQSGIALYNVCFSTRCSLISPFSLVIFVKIIHERINCNKGL